MVVCGDRCWRNMVVCVAWKWLRVVALEYLHLHVNLADEMGRQVDEHFY